MSAIEIQSTRIIQDSVDVTNSTKFLRVSFGRFGNTKKVDSDILKTTADKKLFRTNKTLIVSKELTAIRDYDAALTKWLEKKCIPFPGWPGVFVLPDGLASAVWDRLKEHREARHVLVAAYLAVYPEKRESIKADLKDEFSNSDYPTVAEMARRFRYEYTIRSFETPETLKDISPELYEEQKVAASKQFNSALDEISAVMRQSLLKLVTKVRDKLTPEADGSEKILRESTISNLREFLNDFDFRDISNDAQLKEVVDKAKALLGDGNAADLRTSEDFKLKVYEGMEDLTETLGELVEDKPSRKFRLDED